MGLASEGYELSYQRIPLSRERTPEAADLDTLHAQLLHQPPGATQLSARTAASAAVTEMLQNPRQMMTQPTAADLVPARIENN